MEKTNQYRDPLVHTEHGGVGNVKLNWLRAAVLGANDGIVSIASIVVGVAGAAVSEHTILITGIAGTVAGALSMAVGEYVSVSTQRDTEKAMLEKEKWELQNRPQEELEELTQLYQQKGLSRETAELVAQELTKKDAFAAHVDAELGIDPRSLTNPWHAAYASALSFVSGSLVPLLIIWLTPSAYKVPATFGAIIIALTLTGSISAHVGGSSKARAAIRVVVGGTLAMAVTFLIGKLFGLSNI